MMLKKYFVPAGHWAFFFKFFKGSYSKIFTSVSFSLFQSLLLLPAIIMIRKIFDSSIPKENIPELILFSSLIIIIYIINGILTILTRKISLKITKSAIEEFRNRIFGKFFSFPMIIMNEKEKSRFHTIIVQDTLRIDIMANAVLSQVIPSVFISFGLFAILLYLNFFLFMIISVLFPLLFVLGRYTGKVLSLKVKEYHRYFERFSRRTRTALNFIGFIKVRSNEKREIKNHRDIHAELKERSFAQAWTGGLYSIINRTVVSSLGVVLLFTGGFFVIKGNLSFGSLISFFATMGILKNSLLIVSNLIPRIIEGNESLKTVFDLINRKDKQFYNGVKRFKFKGRIDIQNVTFKYDDSYVLKNFSIVIKPGEIIALWGPNGSGKTTLVRMIIGFYKPLSGVIKADNVRYEELDMEFFRRYIGYVSQNPSILPGTIYDNLIYGLENITDEKINSVIKNTFLESLIEHKSKGIYSYMGENGQFLSKGEVQRVALARSMLGNFSLIILDEPANHIGEKEFLRIFDKLKRLKQNPAVLLITHNSNIAEAADRIVYVDTVLKRFHRGNNE